MTKIGVMRKMTVMIYKMKGMLNGSDDKDEADDIEYSIGGLQ